MVNQALPPQINQPEDCVLVKLSSDYHDDLWVKYFSINLI